VVEAAEACGTKNPIETALQTPGHDLMFRKMAATRKLRGGKIGIASTIYVPKPNDTKAGSAAKKRKVSKSFVYVEAIQEKYPA
jgi:hypothetical protein